MMLRQFHLSVNESTVLICSLLGLFSLHSNHFIVKRNHRNTMVQIVKEGSIESIDQPHSETYWLRTKKPKVDLYRESPFAIERQLEDQRYLMEKNKNPQLYEFTKVDKLRSDKISAHKGLTRSVAMKANVVNKIVREASGIHNFTIVAPPKAVTNPDGKKEKEILQAETNPRVKAYANESKSKPVLVSFGHRPRSASRTFHPSTMKFRLKQGEVLPSSTSTGRIGLPVSVLEKVLHAPPITKLDDLISTPNEILTPNKEDSQSSVFEGANLEDSTVRSPKNFDYDSLFFTKEQQQQMLYNLERHESVYGGKKLKSLRKPVHKPTKLKPLQQSSSLQESNDDTWITSHSNPNIKIAKSTLSLLPPISHDDRPGWDEAFHRIILPSNHVFEMRKSGINMKSDVPLSKLLHRFSHYAIAENQLHPFCTEKQQLDIQERSGQLAKVPPSVPVKGQPLYYDPWDVHVAEINRYHKEMEKQKNEKLRAKEYQDILKTIPKVNYYPTSKLKEIQFQKQLNKIDRALAKIDQDEIGLEESLSKEIDEEQYANELVEQILKEDRQYDESIGEYSQTMTPSKLKEMSYLEEFDPAIVKTAESVESNLSRGSAGIKSAGSNNSGQFSYANSQNNSFRMQNPLRIQEMEGEEEEAEQQERQEEREYSTGGGGDGAYENDLNNYEGNERENNFYQYVHSPSNLSLSSTPKKPYHRLKSTPGGSNKGSSLSSVSLLSLATTNTHRDGINYMEKLENEYPNWSNTEYEIKESISKAKKGDREVLYKTNIKHYLDEYHITNRCDMSSASLQLMPDPSVPSSKVPSRHGSPSGSRQGSRQGSPVVGGSGGSFSPPKP